MILEPYNGIVNRNFHTLSSITDSSLSEYFEGCFNDIIKEFDVYPCWICVKCMRREKLIYGWGTKPKVCPSCRSETVYQIGTFQGWASKVGEMFEWAFYVLIVEKLQTPLTPTPKQCKTHDFEASHEIGIEAKGSPAYIINPDGSKYELSIRGLLRSDTEKKAFANAKEFKRKYPDRYFYIVTNAMPDRLVGYKNRDVNGVYDVTKEKQLREFIEELRSKKA